MKRHVYFIPGMSASSTIFERITLPKDQFEVHLLDWIMPLHTRESLDSYVDRFSKLITEEHPILIGVSFGGIIAQELAKNIQTSKVILISSVKHQQEYQPFYQFVKKTKLYVLYPVSIINILEKLFYTYGSKSLKRTLTTYRKFLPIRNKLYTQWAIRTFLNWEQNHKQNVTHIHGTKDPILPLKYISDAIEIKNGDHAMIITKSMAINERLQEILV